MILGGAMSDLANQNLRQLAALNDDLFVVVIRYWAFDGLRASGPSDQEIKGAATDAVKEFDIQEGSVDIGSLRSTFVDIFAQSVDDAQFQNDLAKAIDRAGMAKLTALAETIVAATAIVAIVLAWKLKKVKIQRDGNSVIVETGFYKLGDSVAAAAVKVAAKLGLS